MPCSGLWDSTMTPRRYGGVGRGARRGVTQAPMRKRRKRR